MPAPQRETPADAPTASTTTVSTSRTCPECHQVFSWYRSYKRHMDKRQARGTCPRPTGKNKILLTGAQIKCLKCNREFRSRQGFQQHEQRRLARGICPGLPTNAPQPYQCTKCNLAFNSRSALTWHTTQARKRGKCPPGRGRHERHFFGRETGQWVDEVR